MEAKQSIQSRNDPITALGERIARIEAKMDFVATHKDLAAMDAKIEATRTEIQATHTEIEATRTEIASLKGTLLAEIAGIKTLVADREASMQRWLLGITATTVVGMGAAMVGVAAALIWAIA